MFEFSRFVAFLKIPPLPYQMIFLTPLKDLWGDAIYEKNKKNCLHFIMIYFFGVIVLLKGCERGGGSKQFLFILIIALKLKGCFMVKSCERGSQEGSDFCSRRICL